MKTTKKARPRKATRKTTRRRPARRARQAARKSLTYKVVSRIPRLVTVAGLHPLTTAMADHLGKLQRGKVARFSFGSTREAKNRAAAIRQLQRRKAVHFKVAVQRGPVVYIEK